MESICCALNFFCFIIICIILPGLRTYQPADKHQAEFFFRAVRFILILLLLYGVIILFYIFMGRGYLWAQTGAALQCCIALEIVSDIFFFSIVYFYIRFLERYLAVNVGEKNWMKPIAVITAVLCLLGIITLIIVRIYSGETTQNHLIPGTAAYWICHICGYSLSILGIALILRYAKQIGWVDFFTLSSFFLLPTVVSIVRLFIPHIHLLAVCGAISIILIFINIHLKQNKTLQEDELELSQTQLMLLNRQIRPHFLYNTLNTIYVLCGKDPKQAREVVAMFSEYLRGKVTRLDQHDVIPFSQELDLVRNYLSLEKMRFGDDLQVEYDIQTTEFSLPPLSLQFMVENSIKHGLSKKEGGGTVTIRSIEKADCYEVSVIDDGVGPAAAFKEDGSGTQTGILNVKNRLRIICDGSLQISGETGVGTTAVISIPKNVGKSGRGRMASNMV